MPTPMMDTNTPSAASSAVSLSFHCKTKKSFANLPNELLEFVLKRFAMQNLIPLRLVCRLWSVAIPKMRCFLQKKSLKLFGSYDCAANYEQAMANGLYHFVLDVELLKLKPALLAPTLARLHSFTFRAYHRLDLWTPLEDLSTIRYLGSQCTRLCVDYVDCEAMSNSLFNDFSFIDVNFVRNLTFLRLSKIEDPNALWQLAPHFPSLEVIHIGFDEITFCEWMFTVVQNAEWEMGYVYSARSRGPDPDDVFRVAMFPRFSGPIGELHFDFYRTVFMSHTLLNTFLRTLSVMFPRVHKLAVSVYETAPSPSEAQWFAIQVSKFIDKVFGKFEEHEVAVVYSTGRVVLDQSIIEASRGWYEEQ